LVPDLRRLQKTSDGTYFVTLPKSWVAELGLERGDVLSLRKEGSKLSVEPHGGKVRREMEAVVLKPSKTLEREIGENYLLGADVIEIRSDAIIQSEVRERIKRIIKRLVGLEIVEEGARKMVIQCLLEPSLLTPEKVLRRLHLIALEMGKDAVEALTSGDVAFARVLVERDDEVDRMYFLLVRIVRMAVSNPLVAERMAVTPIDCLDYRMLASLIEHFADYSTLIADVAISCGAPTPGGVADLIKGVGEAICNSYRKAFDAILLKNLNLALEVSSESKSIENLIRVLESKLYAMDPKAREKLMPLISIFNSMREICVDMADLTRTK